MTGGELIRAEVEAAGGRVQITTGSLLVLFAAETGDAGAAARVAARLAEHGVEVAPRLEAFPGRVELSLAQQEDLNDATVDAVNEPTPITPRAELRAEAAATSPAVAGTGAATVAIVAVIAGVTAFWGYGLIFAGAGVVATLIARFAFGSLIRIFWPSRGWLPLRAALVGAAPAVVLVAIALVALVAPIEGSRAAAQRDRVARDHLAAAVSALRERDVRLARASLERSEDSAALPEQPEVRERLEALNAAITAERERNAMYDRALASFAARKYKDAIRDMKTLGNWRDAELQRERFSRAGSRARIRRAVTFMPDRPRLAIAAAREALAFRESREARRIIARSETIITARHRAELERQRRAAEARAARAAAEQARIEAERARAEAAERERQRREAAELQATLDAADDGASDGGNWCGATRDGDGDGIWCEGR